MEPNTQNQSAPSFDLPQPQAPEMSGAINPNMPASEVNQQTEAHNMELPAAQAPLPPASTPAGVPVAPVQPATQVPLGGQPGVAAQATTDDELTAEDSDLIEKAWVEKAKAIVAQTKDDPYRQNHELNKVKASYIKKRYQKDIKLNEEATS